MIGGAREGDLIRLRTTVIETVTNVRRMCPSSGTVVEQNAYLSVEQEVNMILVQSSALVDML